jgi:hypothetical protein
VIRNDTQSTKYQKYTESCPKIDGLYSFIFIDHAAKTSNFTDAKFRSANPEAAKLSHKHMFKLEVSSYQKRGSAGG